MADSAAARLYERRLRQADPRGWFPTTNVFASVMAFGLVTGMAVQYFATGTLLEFDHKTLFSLLTFAVISLLLFARYRRGLRGRRAARLVLLAYLLLTIAYPGVKFVTDVLLA